jgi:predicted Fe-S protein YdhL (DUF1289 family)
MGFPFIGGSKSKEKAIFKWQRMSPKARGKILKLSTVKSRKTTRGKFRAAIRHLEKKS